MSEAIIRPFVVRVPDDQLADLSCRLEQTRWPDRETVEDRSQGVTLGNMQRLVEYWRTQYDWRRAEARLNAHPQFMTMIDGLDIHFIHVRSRHRNAMPLRENRGRTAVVASAMHTDEIQVPVAITVFPGEVYRAPETWARRAYRDVSYFHEADEGGHFASWEQPEVFAAELRAAFQVLRTSSMLRE